VVEWQNRSMQMFIIIKKGGAMSSGKTKSGSSEGGGDERGEKKRG